MAAELDTIVRSVPRSLVHSLLADLGCSRDDVREIRIDHLGVTVEMWARNEHGDRYMTGGEAAKHVVCIPIESSPPTY